MTQPYWISWDDKHNNYVVMHDQQVATKVLNPDKIIEYLMLMYKASGEKPDVIAVNNPDLEKMIKDALDKFTSKQSELTK